MAITKIQSESLNLADDYTFTGTVAGAGLAEADIKTLFNASGSAPVYACRAWVNFNGSGTVAIRESGNVSSITDNGSGNYTVNFSVAMPDTNYMYASGLTNDGHSAGYALAMNTATTSNANLFGLSRSGGNTNYDSGECFAAFIR